jgi:hypothetical protein
MAWKFKKISSISEMAGAEANWTIWQQLAPFLD